MSNTFTKNFQDGTAFFEADLTTALQTLKPSLSNLSLATQGSTSFEILRSNGSNVTPVWSGVSDIISNSTISAAASNNIINALSDNITSTAANEIVDSTTRTTGTSVTGLNIGVSNTFSGTYTSTTSTAISSSEVEITTSGRPVLVFLSNSDTSTTNSVTITGGTTANDRTRGYIEIKRDSSVISTITLSTRVDGPITNLVIETGLANVSTIDAPTAGTYTYSIAVYIDSDTSSLTLPATVLNVVPL